MHRTSLMICLALILSACAASPTVVPTIAPTRISATTATPNSGLVKVSEKDGMKLLYIPAGKFMMGNDNDDDNEKPAHMVLLAAFWIDQTEITNGMYALCVNDEECNAPGSKKSLTRPTYYGETRYNNYPIIFVD